MKRFAIALALLVLIGCDSVTKTGQFDRRRLDQIAMIFDQGDTPKAVVQLEEYVETFPKDDLAWTILGHAYREIDRLDESEKAYVTALKLDSKQLQATTGLGILHRTRGDYDAAMKAYERALKIDPNYAQAYSSIVTIALKRYDDEKALEYAKKGYELDSTDPVIASNLAVAYHYNNDFENRDKYTRIAEELGYRNVDSLKQIFSGELTVRD